MKILLLGGDGQLGFEMKPLLARRGDVIAPSRRDLDVADLDALRVALRQAKPDLIVNGTAYNEVDKAESEPDVALKLNAHAVAALGEYGKASGAAVIHYSTDFVFDGAKPEPYVEDDPPSPLSAYGRSKLEGERMLSAIDAPAIVLRTAWVYSTRRKSFVSMMLKLAREKKELRVVTDQVGNPTFCGDLARATDRVIEWLGPRPGEKAFEARGVYHAAGSGACSRFELANAVLELDPRRSEHTVTRIDPTTSAEFPTLAKRPARAILDCTKLKNRFGATLRPWKEALADALRERGGAPSN